MKELTIRPLSMAKRTTIAEHRVKRQLFASRKKVVLITGEAEQRVGAPNLGFDVDPVEFARAFAPFRSDVEALFSPDEQVRFSMVLRGYLSGNVDHNVWRLVLGALNCLRRASGPPEPHDYWVRSSPDAIE